MHFSPTYSESEYFGPDSNPDLRGLDRSATLGLKLVIPVSDVKSDLKFRLRKFRAVRTSEPTQDFRSWDSNVS